MTHSYDADDPQRTLQIYAPLVNFSCRNALLGGLRTWPGAEVFHSAANALDALTIATF